jgi:hypothetical protein
MDGAVMAGNRIFVGHIHEDDEHIGNVQDLLASKGYEVQVSAIDSSSPNEAQDPDYIMSKYIIPKIQWCDTVVVLISPGTKDHPWIDREIERAQEEGKRIVGVWTHGSAECDLPQGLTEYADAVVGWQADQIYGAIDGTINNWTASDGSPRDRQKIRQYGC